MMVPIPGTYQSSGLFLLESEMIMIYIIIVIITNEIRQYA